MNNATTKYANRFNSLGVPIDDLDLDSACRRVMSLVRDGRRDGRPRYVATVNVDFLVNAVGRSGRGARYPELLEILRSADMVTADGFPVVWLSRLVGRPLRERVTGADLVPALAPAAAEAGASLFLVGGSDTLCARAASVLTARNPDLEIAGMAAPIVHVAGPELANSDSSDAALVDAINASGADIVLLGLGNPKQELWFQRNRHRLKVPVTLGVGGTLAFICGEVRRAPAWVQRFNLEWVFRISQDPVRLWRRYLRGVLDFACMCGPLVWLRLRELLAHRAPASEPVEQRVLWGSRSASVLALRLPARVDAGCLDEVHDIVAGDEGGQLVIVDFSQVRQLSMAAAQGVFALGRLFATTTRSGLMVGIKRRIRRTLRRVRLLDVIKECSSSEELMDAATPDFCDQSACQTFALANLQLVFLSGRLTGETLDLLGLESCVTGTRSTRDFVIDLRRATRIAGPAAARLARLAASPSVNVHLSGLGRDQYQAFELVGLRPNRTLSDTVLVKRIFGDNA